jgi:ATP-dependent DNA helicase DinG
MARGVGEVLDSGGILVAEAPTGIGKSLAYLLPAALHSLSRRVPVAIATHTLNLQDQLLEKDVPLVASALAARGWEEALRVTVVKGRTNYLCRRRWDEARRGSLPLADGTVERLAGWVIDTETGDLSEAEEVVGDLGRDAAELAADPTSCNWRRCGRGDDCFLRRLKRRAASSHLVVLNHSLLFHHLLRDSAFLPDADALVLDEAQHLERALTEACGREVTRARVHRLLGRALGGRSFAGSEAGGDRSAADPLALLGQTAGPVQTGELARVRERLRGLPSDVERLNLSQRLDAAAESLKRAAALTEGLLRGLARRLPGAIGSLGPAAGGAGEGLALRYDALGARELMGEEGERARNALADAVRGLRDLASAIGAATPPAPGLGEDGGLAEIAGQVAEWSRLAADLESLAAPGDGEVCWAEIERREASLYSLPLTVATAFAERILDRFRATVLTSATLTVTGSFDHVVGRLGLDRRDRGRLHFMDLGSPFEHERQCVLLADPGFPPPAAPEYGAAVGRCLERLLARVPRRILVLFTSNALLRQVHALLKPAAVRLGRPLLAQGIDGPRHALARRHRNDAGSVLLGTSSFWEGVDFPGDELEVLVITRLPFLVPGEPLTAARAERLAADGEHPFTSLFLPEAVLRFRQGFGRLIRSLDDRGAVICLDPRLLTASYGQVFARSLPVRPRIARGEEALVESVIAWFATGGLPAEAPPIASSRERRRPGTARSPRAAAAQGYAVDDLDHDLRDEAVLDRAALWQRRTFTRDDGSTITIERLRPAEDEETRGAP